MELIFNIVWGSFGIWAWLHAYKYFNLKYDVRIFMFFTIPLCVLGGPLVFLSNALAGMYKKKE